VTFGHGQPYEGPEGVLSAVVTALTPWTFRSGHRASPAITGELR